MPRTKPVALHTQVIHHAINAPLHEVESHLATVAAIVAARKAGGLKDPSLPLTPATAATPRVRPPRVPAAAPASAPVHNASPAAPARRRGRPVGTARPPVPAAMPVAAPAAAATPSQPLPDATDDTPMGED